ncbi:MAG: ATP synthase F1 subunit gamma [Elusimicrobia bacterium]|nr:ATP synthase F1 subunit gamma [Elusimicrobiota bacterium]
MPENPQVIKKRINTAVNISQIARAMEMISASKIRKAEKAVINNRPYSEKITYIVSRFLSNKDTHELQHPFLTKNPSTKKLIIAISPDKGLCGGLPGNLFGKLIDYGNRNNYLITIGKKVETFSARYDFNLIASFPMGTSFPSYSFIYPILEIAKEYYIERKVSEVLVIFSEFKNLMIQRPIVYKLLPIEPQKDLVTRELPYIFETGIRNMVYELMPYYLEVKFYNAFIQAFTSEQAARMTAMRNAKENAIEITEYLTLNFNKLRQEKITNEILDQSNNQFA